MAGTRSALIVATYAYDDPGLTRLRAPGRDADALAEVLADPDIGGFEVETVVNQPWHQVSLAVARFFQKRKPDDLLLLHFSCHGVKDDSGELYFAAKDTQLDLLEASAVPSTFVNKTMDRSRAGRILLLLDCCYSGAFARGLTAKGTNTVDIKERLGGRGRAVITASSALQYAFEGDVLDSSTEAAGPSVFTSALVRGLQTGEADRDLDGWVSLGELYAYVHDEVTRVTPDQTPKKWEFEIEGDLHVARRGAPVKTPSPLPEPILESMGSLLNWERESAIQPLRMLLTGNHPGRALAARLALEEMAAHDDSDRVKAAARAVLGGIVVPAPRSEVVLPAAETKTAAEPEIEIEAKTPPEPDPEPEPEPDVGPELETQAAPETEVQPEAKAEPEPEPKPGPVLVPEAQPQQPPPPVVDPGPAPPPEPDPTTPGPTPNWRLLGVVAACVVVAVVLVIVVIQLNSGDDTGGGDSGDGSSEPTLPDTVALLTRVNDEGDRQLIGVDTDSGDVQVVVDDPAYELPTISPDRKWLVYLEGDGDGRVPRLARVNGSDSQLLLDDQMTQECPFTSRPAWSPDGSMLAFVCLSADQSRTGLWTVNRDGSEVRELLDSGQPMQGPTWGDDGRIYYVAAGESEGDPSKIWAVPEDGEGEATPLTDDEDGWDSHVDWSDGGVFFLRSSSPQAPGDAMFVTPDGVTEALSGSGTLESPTAAPEGKSAVWLEVSSDDEELSTLWVQREGEDEPTELLTGDLGPPAWGSR